MKAAKGSDFEREICKKLSMWWTRGERDDVFWRSSQSGGRATHRRRTKGVGTYGQEGDIAAIDPIGAPLLKVFAIELKRGSSIGSPGDLIDTRPTDAIRPFEAAINQAQEAQESSKSLGWLLICRRDHRIPMVYGDYQMMHFLSEMSPFRRLSCVTQFVLKVNKKEGSKKTCFWALSLESFLKHVEPLHIIKCLNSQE